MQIFISWSGKKSYSIAIVLKKYLKLFIQNLSPYLSSEDSRVFTLLFDDLSPSDIGGPLAHFQHTIFNKDDFEKLLIEIYNQLEEKPLDLDTLKITFNTFWPQLEKEINEIAENDLFNQSFQNERTNEDFLKEILLLNRQILNNQDFISKDYLDYLSKMALESEIELFSPDKSEFNHPIKVVIDPIEIEENNIRKLVKVIIEKNKVNIEDSKNPENRRGVLISIIFDSEVEENNLWEINYTFHKGSTYVSSSRIPVIEKNINESTIWRD